MPYIKKEDRTRLDETINALIDKLKENNFNEGEMNYAISRIITVCFLQNKNYATINKITGVMECAKMEFYRCHAVPYEDVKKDRNGDISMYSDFKDIDQDEYRRQHYSKEL